MGTHRVTAAEVIALLLSASNPAIDVRVAKGHFVSLITHLALSHPHNSTLQTRALRIIKHSCQSSCHDLMGPLFVPGWGIHLTQPGSDKLCEPLPEQLASIGGWEKRARPGGPGGRLGISLLPCPLTHSLQWLDFIVYKYIM